jgi:hypothetical protein
VYAHVPVCSVRTSVCVCLCMFGQDDNRLCMPTFLYVQLGHPSVYVSVCLVRTPVCVCRCTCYKDTRVCMSLYVQSGHPCVYVSVCVIRTPICACRCMCYQDTRVYMPRSCIFCQDDTRVCMHLYVLSGYPSVHAFAHVPRRRDDTRQFRDHSAWDMLYISGSQL